MSKELITKQGGGRFNAPIPPERVPSKVPQRKTHANMSTPELVKKLEKKAGVSQEQLSDKQIKQAIKKVRKTKTP